MIFEVKNKTQINTVVSLAKEIWTEHYTTIIGKEQVDYMLNKFQSKEAISNQINVDGFIYYLIQENDAFIGYIGVQAKRKELFLSKIYIKISERGKGYGKKAMHFLECLTMEKCLNKITLTVNKNNFNTIKSYENIGFKIIGSFVQNIGNGFVMDDYRMEKVV